MKFFLSLFILFFITLFANEIDTNTSYIDVTHKMLSNKVSDYSNVLDQGVSTLFIGKNKQDEPASSNNSSNIVDNFFKNEKFINETEKSFVNIIFYTNMQSKYNNKSATRVNAHIALTRTNKKFNFFISGVNENMNKDIINKGTDTEIGVNYFRSDYYKVQSKYSIGIREFYPLIRARYYKVFTTVKWRIEPMQIFEYSSKDAFKESTFIYFDKTFIDKSLLRFTLHRETQTKLTGMNYDFSTQYYWSSNQNNIIRVSQIFSGNTQYKANPSSQEYSGINNYTTTLNFRTNIWKKWLFYEISPSVNFHKENKYKANYVITFSINLYFGNF